MSLQYLFSCLTVAYIEFFIRGRGETVLISYIDKKIDESRKYWFEGGLAYSDPLGSAGAQAPTDPIVFSIIE